MAGSWFDPLPAVLVQSLERRIVDPAGRAREDGCLRIRNGWGGSLSVRQLLAWTDLVGVGDETPLIAGWWQGMNEIGDIEDALGTPIMDLALAPGTEMDWRLWRVMANPVISVTASFRQSPGVLFSEASPGWVVTTGPADDVTWVYVD